ncbi:hypothetical protein GLE_0947 [Lysobacter enzymogenes]|uniref:Uncharacterized protein n=1 Tax=Lysobacter enzymogenes TaxID=69 RepID=A0A0S2DCQ1_LYSEN|nr:hypothetical protein GLE_0947 [Lysobacter enzymogenes]
MASAASHRSQLAAVLAQSRKSSQPSFRRKPKSHQNIAALP